MHSQFRGTSFLFISLFQMTDYLVVSLKFHLILNFFTRSFTEHLGVPTMNTKVNEIQSQLSKIWHLSRDRQDYEWIINV